MSLSIEELGYIEALRQRMGLEEHDTSKDKAIEAMEPMERVRMLAGWFLGSNSWADEFSSYFNSQGLFITTNPDAVDKEVPSLEIEEIGYIEELRQRLGLEEDDNSQDDEIVETEPMERVRMLAGWYLGDSSWADTFKNYFSSQGLYVTNDGDDMGIIIT